MLGEATGVLLEKDQVNTLQTQLDLETNLEAPIYRGQRVGTLSVMDGDTVLQEVPVVAAEDCPRQSIWEIFRQMLSYIGMRKK